MNLRKIHYLSGLIVTSFVGFHLYNHVCSIFGPDKHIEIMNSFRLIYRNIFVETIFLLAVLVQIISGLKLFMTHRKAATSNFDKLHIWSGLYLAIFFVIHLSAIFVGRFFLHLDTNFYFGVAGLNSFPSNLFFIPYYALAVISFFGHIAAIHSKKMKHSIFGLSPKNQSFIILAFGFVLTITILFGSTNRFRGVEIPNTESKKLVGGGCEGCELMYIDMPEKISSEHTSIGWTEGKQKLILTGKVYQLDGKTPAPNVIIYYWHTDDNGLYSSNKETPKKAKAHGKLRGWVKSDENGYYKIKTSRPAAYPNQDIPQHIHLSIKEPDLNNEYFADLYFDDDPLYLKHKKKYGKIDRAGTELLRVVLDGDIQIAEHNIVLGLNIPDYPIKNKADIQSGLNIGEDQPSFMPFHAYGPDKGTRTCPVCKYGRYHGIVYFVGENPNWEDVKAWLKYLDDESIKREKYLKAYFVYGNSLNYHKKNRQKELDNIGNALKLQKIALTFVPSLDDVESEANLNRINPKAENTFIIYRHRTIVDKYVNLKPTKENFNKISEALDKTKSNYFELPEPKHN